MSTLKYNTWLNTDNTENYKCRAWVNFNGTGTVAIRASGNVSSITDNGSGDYTINFSNALSDANYAVSVGQVAATTANDGSIGNFGILTTGSMGSAATTKTTTAIRILSRYLYNGGTGVFDVTECNLAIFR
jgi:hypothetical protein